jgi:dTMP kinase
MHRGKLIAFMSTFASVASTRGPFILFEGIDRCGKTTQCSLIAEHLSKLRSTQLIRFPDRSSSIGKLINSYLQCNANLNDQTIHLLFSANRWESSSEIEQKLLSGTTLVLFYIFSFYHLKYL